MQSIRKKEKEGQGHPLEPQRPRRGISAPSAVDHRDPASAVATGLRACGALLVRRIDLNSGQDGHKKHKKRKTEFDESRKGHEVRTKPVLRFLRETTPG